MDIFESRTSVRAFTDEPVAKSQVMGTSSRRHAGAFGVQPAALALLRHL